MASILEGELADEVTEALEIASVPRTLTITRTEHIPNPEEPWEPGEEVITTYSCRGWTESYGDDAVDGTLIDARDVKVMVLTTTIAIAPTDVTDTVSVDGRTFAIITVRRDASGSLYEVQARA